MLTSLDYRRSELGPQCVVVRSRSRVHDAKSSNQIFVLACHPSRSRNLERRDYAMWSSVGWLVDVKLSFVTCSSIQRFGVYHGLHYRTAGGDFQCIYRCFFVYLSLGWMALLPSSIHSSSRVVIIAFQRDKNGRLLQSPYEPLYLFASPCKIGPVSLYTLNVRPRN